ncbi:MAG: YdiU family protein [Pseudomonadota bacterium]
MAAPLFPFDNTYAGLPQPFFAALSPTPPAAPTLLRLNEALAEALGLDPAALSGAEGVAALSGQRVPEGAAPLAMAYAGHQFGQFVPQLGDGRALLLGEVIDRVGLRRDIQLKGSGPTPFSRRGDGRAALGPVLREYILSEAMHALGIPTTRALAAVTTGEPVYREEPMPGAVLTRVAASHLRVGTFQYFAARGDADALRTLTAYALTRHDPDLAAEGPDEKASLLLERVMDRQARLVALWMGVGFIHGVMNTDNCTISGETIDYGPCAFMDTYDPATVYSSIDQWGRYAYGNQPSIVHWNLSRLAQALLPILGDTEDAAVTAAQTAIDTFPERFRTAYLSVFRAKLGLSEQEMGDETLIADLLNLMAAGAVDFTNTFRTLGQNAVSEIGGGPAARSAFKDPSAFDEWAVRWHDRMAREATPAEARAVAMDAANPARIPRNHRVEEALAAAENEGDLAPFDRLMAALATPYAADASFDAYTDPPKPHEVVRATFCGT